MVGWNDFVPLTVPHSSCLETFVPAKLVNLLVPECAANILTTVKIYSYLCFPILQSASTFSRSDPPLKFHPWPPVSENFLLVPALRSLSLPWVPTILARPSHLVFPLSAPGCLSSVFASPISSSTQEMGFQGGGDQSTFDVSEKCHLTLDSRS